MPLELIDADNIAEAERIARAMSSYWGQFAHTGNPATGSGQDMPGWLRWPSQDNYLIFDSTAGGGIRMHSGGVDRASIFQQLAADDAGLGGQAGICRAYNNLFGDTSIFGFAAACEAGDTCAGASQNFCPTN